MAPAHLLPHLTIANAVVCLCLLLAAGTLRSPIAPAEWASEQPPNNTPSNTTGRTTIHFTVSVPPCGRQINTINSLRFQPLPAVREILPAAGLRPSALESCPLALPQTIHARSTVRPAVEPAVNPAVKPALKPAVKPSLHAANSAVKHNKLNILSQNRHPAAGLCPSAQHPCRLPLYSKTKLGPTPLPNTDQTPDQTRNQTPDHTPTKLGLFSPGKTEKVSKINSLPESCHSSCRTIPPHLPQNRRLPLRFLSTA